MNHRFPIACLAVAIVMVAAPLAQAAAPALFGTVEVRNPSLDALPQWQRMLEQVDQEKPTYEACARDRRRCTSRGLGLWLAMMDGLTGKSAIEQVQAVNLFVNRWTYRTDDQNYGKSDYWATPTEFFARSGDCEDYAIAKYVSLRQLNFSADQLRLVVVKDTVRQLAHAVLAVYVDGTILILDNLSNRATPHDTIATYAPYYSVNETARWIHAEPQKTIAATPDRHTKTISLRSITSLFAKS